MEAVLIERDGRLRYLFIRTQSHAYNHPPTHGNNQPKPFLSIHLFVYALAFVASVSVRFRNKERPRNGISRFGRPRLLRNRTETVVTQAIYAPNSFATLETRRELEPKCIPQVFLGSLLGMRRSAIGLFSPNVPSNSSRSLCEI